MFEICLSDTFEILAVNVKKRQHQKQLNVAMRSAKVVDNN